MSINRRWPNRTLLAAIALVTFVAILWTILDDRGRSLAFNTIKLIAGTLAISLPVGTVLGLMIARTDLPLRRVVAAMLGWLLVVPLYLQAAAWQSGFGLYGWYTLALGGALEDPWLIGWRGAIWVHAVAAVPWVAFVVGLAARQVEPQLEEAALLDASPLQVFRRITLRRIWPAVGLASLWIALLTAAEMTVTDLYQVRTYAEEVYVEFAAPSDLSAQPLGPWIGAAVVTVLVIGALLLLAGGVQQSVKLLPRRPHCFELGAWRWPAALLVAVCLMIVIGVPLFNLIYKAGVVVQPANGAVERTWSAAKCMNIVAAAPEQYHGEIVRSLVIAVGAATLALAVALPLAWLARRGGTASLPAMSIAAAALAIPGPLLGIGLIHVLNHPALPLGWIYNTLAASTIAQAIRGLPLAIFIVWVALRSIPIEQLEAASLDGATAWSQFWHVALPQRWFALLGAWASAWMVAMNELPATVLLEVPGRATLPIAVFQLLHGSGEDRLAGVVLFMLLAYAAMGVIAIAVWRFSSSSGRIAVG